MSASPRSARPASPSPCSAGSWSGAWSCWRRRSCTSS
jgi:hypothetical protein